MPVCIGKFQNFGHAKILHNRKKLNLCLQTFSQYPLKQQMRLLAKFENWFLKLHQSHATSVGHVVIFDPGIFHQERRGYSSRKNGGHCQEGKPGKQPHP